MSEWKPIETAPRDGRAIFGFAKDYSVGEMTTVYWTGEYWDLVVCGSFAEDGEWNPTHWMPLPEPPEDSHDR